MNDPIRMVLHHPTPRGRVFVGQTIDGRFHVVWEGERLSSFVTAIQAVEAAANGDCWTASDGTDVGSLGLSSDIADWSSTTTRA
jgi:hypothetical protein